MVGVRKFCRRTMTLEGFRRDWLAGGVLARRASTRERGTSWFLQRASGDETGAQKLLLSRRTHGLALLVWEA